MIILDNELYRNFCNFIFDASSSLAGTQIPEDILTMTSEMLIDIRKLMDGRAEEEKTLSIGSEVRRLLFPNDSAQGSSNRIRLFIPEENAVLLKNVLNKFGFAQDNRLAIEKALEFFYPTFSYHVARD